MIEDASGLGRLLSGSESEAVIMPVGRQSPDARQATVNHVDNPAVRAAAEEYFNSPERLHGDKMPSVTIQTEQPVHRMMIYLHAQGASQKDIAAQTGFSASYISNVLRQPWARQRLISILNEAGRDQVKHFLSNEVAPSLEVLREIRDTAHISPQARIAASNSILDRALGKPVARIESDNTNRSGPTDLARIDADLAEVRRQLAEKGAPPDGIASN